MESVHRFEFFWQGRDEHLLLVDVWFIPLTAKGVDCYLDYSDIAYRGKEHAPARKD